MGRAAGITDAQLANLSTWRETTVYSPLERLVLEYTEVLSATPVIHRPDLHVALGEHLSEKQLAELTNAIAWENYRARFNRAYGVAAQDFSEGAYCVLPDRHPPTTSS